MKNIPTEDPKHHWSFLNVKDKVHLLTTNKSIRKICIRINLKVPVVIKIKNLKRYKNDESSRKEMIKNLVNSFPNISKLFFTSRIIFGEESLLRLKIMPSLA